MFEKRPRQYAAEIAALPTRQERTKALDKVPQHLRDLVAEHVKTTFAMRSQTNRSNKA